MVHTENGFLEESKAKGLKQSSLSGTEFRRLLRAGEPIPEWFSFKSVIAALRSTATA
jgi:sulfate adenylyltransferase